MNPCKFNMLHHSRHKGMGSVADGVCLAFRGMAQKTVNQYGPIGGYTHCRIHIAFHALCIIDHFHSSSAQHIGGTHHHRIADLFCNFQRLFDIDRHA